MLRAALVVLAVIASSVQPAAAQTSNAELAARQLKDARLLDVDPAELPARNIVPPSRQTSRVRYFGYRLILGGLYEPTIFEDETWIDVGCQSLDPRVSWDRDDHGSSSLVRVHAIVYELDRDGSLNTDTAISTVDTSALDEGVCDVSRGIDTTFIEIPRTFEAAVVSLFSVASRGQRAEVVENVERTLAP